MEIYRQGDVILEKVDGIPIQHVKVANTFETKGETGESHVLTAEVFSPIRVRGVAIPQVQVIQVGEGGAIMNHPQHPSLPIPAGIYRPRKVRTYSEQRSYVYVDD